MNLFTFLAGKATVEPFKSTDKDGLSRAFAGLAQSIKSGDKGAIQLSMTILQVGRVIPGWKEPDTSTITDSPLYDEKVMRGLNDFIRYRSPNFLRSITRSWKSPHLTNKMGPKGRAILTSIAEIPYLPKALYKAIEELGGPQLIRYKRQLQRDFGSGFNIPGVKESRKGILRRLSIIKDTEGKSRVIAIGDYWSQTTLKPLHEALLGALRGWKECDVTFGQQISPFGSNDHSYHSFDLTAATDRIPISCYEWIINHAYGKESFEAWKDIKTTIPFEYESELYHYRTGQPKG